MLIYMQIASQLYFIWLFIYFSEMLSFASGEGINERAIRMQSYCQFRKKNKNTEIKKSTREAFQQTHNCW